MMHIGCGETARTGAITVPVIFIAYACMEHCADFRLTLVTRPRLNRRAWPLVWLPVRLPGAASGVENAAKKPSAIVLTTWPLLSRVERLFRLLDTIIALQRARQTSHSRRLRLLPGVQGRFSPYLFCPA